VSDPRATHDAGSCPARTLAAWCGELAAIVARIQPTVFAHRSPGGAIGEHVRHGLDHLLAVIDGAPQGVVDYERRRRGWAGERDPELAAMELWRCAASFTALSGRDLDRPIRVRQRIHPGAEALETTSSWGRELVVALSHEIHHAAILRPRLEAAGVALSPDFGVAPGTIAYRRSVART